MSRDFLITFDNQIDCLNAAKILKKLIKLIKLNFLILKLEKNLIFVILSFNKKINKDFVMKIDDYKSLIYIII